MHEYRNAIVLIIYILDPLESSKSETLVFHN